MGTFWQNLRFGFRVLTKNPGFAIVTILTLALGIGANTAIFSVVYAALLRSLPYQDPGKLITLAETRDQLLDSGATQSSYPDFMDWKKTQKSFQSMAAFAGDGFIITGNGEPKATLAVQVTPNFFSTLGVRPMLGRDFLNGEDQGDGPHVVILSHGFWRSDFGGDPNVVGRTVRLDNKPVTIVGVLPKEFEFAPVRSAPLWVPYHPSNDALTRRSLRWMTAFGRLAPGVSFRQAQTEMEGITARLKLEYPKEDGAISLLMGSLRERIVGKIRPLLLLLFGAVGFVLLIACANVANLLMTRSMDRRKEFAVRTALGASRTDLVIQLLTESLLLSFAGAGFGLLGAQWGVTVLVNAIPDSQLQSMPYLRDASLNIPVLLFLCAVTFLTGILFGLAPGWAMARSPVNDVLKDETRGGTSDGHAKFRNIFVVGEIAISLVLLVGAGLMLESLRALLKQNPGFDAHNVLTFNVYLPDSSYPTDKAYPNDSPPSREFTHRFSDRLRNLPGVLDVGAASGVPMDGNGGSIRFLIEGRPKAIGHEDEASLRDVDARYFQAMRIPLIEGRFFAPTDTPDSPQLAMVNQSFVKMYFPNGDPIGKRIRFTFNAKEPYREIVGVVGNVAEYDLADPPVPFIYVDDDQNSSSAMSYIVRTAADPVAFIGSVRTILHEMDPQVPLVQPQLLEQYASESPSVFLRRYPSYLIGSFAGLALVLAMVGLYGLISYTVQQRTREIGIRMALGAQSRDVLHLVLKQGIGAVLVGVGIGIVAGQALTRLMASLLYGVKPGDALTFACVSILLVSVAAAACAIPARRAMRVDPIIALRYE